MHKPCRHPTVLSAALLCGCLCAPGAWAQSRGELLYDTHCVTCHSTQMHWREKKQVVDWASLRAQVRQWQAEARLAWTDDDIEQVARHLNDRFYRLPLPSGPGTVAHASSP